MEPELPFRKIIIDSRNAVVGDAENFTISLPSTLQLPPQTACYVLDVALSFGFYTVEAGYNDQLYFWERQWDGSSDDTRVATATLAAGSYTATSLATGIQTSINAVSQFGAAYPSGGPTIGPPSDPKWVLLGGTPCIYYQNASLTQKNTCFMKQDRQHAS